jgi:glucose/arabinose dehydrogenase
MSKHTPRRATTAAAAIATAAITLVAAAAPASAKPAPITLLSGLSSPKGVAVAPDGNVVIGQGAFGAPGPVLALQRHGRGHGQTTEVTPPVGLTDLAVASNGSGWGIGSEDGVLYRRDTAGNIAPVLDIIAYQQSDPDPYNQMDDPAESNPYGLGVMPDGDALVADAANNDIIRVSPDGTATTVARFDATLIPTDQVPPDIELPPGFELPPELPAEAVPTTVTVGPGGFIYVGQLPGFPFRVGSSRVWQIDPDADGALCSVTTPSPDCRVYAEGFTAIQDIAFNPHNGALYVYELAAEGVFAFEAGLETGAFPPAVLLEVKRNGKRTELASGQLSQPGGIAIANDGTLFLTDEVFTGGRLLQIHA